MIANACYFRRAASVNVWNGLWVRDPRVCTEFMNEWNCSDFECVRKPTESRFIDNTVLYMRLRLDNRPLSGRPINSLIITIRKYFWPLATAVRSSARIRKSVRISCEICSHNCLELRALGRGQRFRPWPPTRASGLELLSPESLTSFASTFTSCERTKRILHISHLRQ